MTDVREFRAERLNSEILGEKDASEDNRPWRRKRTVTGVDGRRVDRPWMWTCRPPIVYTAASDAMVATGASWWFTIDLLFSISPITTILSIKGDGDKNLFTSTRSLFQEESHYTVNRSIMISTRS